MRENWGTVEGRAMDKADAPRVSLGEHVKRRRLQLGLTQDDLAAKLNKKNRSYVGHIERNRANARRPSVAMLADLAAGLEESLSALLAQTTLGAMLEPHLTSEQLSPGQELLIANIKTHFGHLSPEQAERAWRVLQAAFAERPGS